MKPEQKVLRLGSIMIIGAILLRLLCYFPATASGAARLMVFLQTGRLLTSTSQPAVEITAPTETVGITVHKPQRLSASFSPEDASLVKLLNTTSYQVDVESMLQQKLDWNLYDDEPTVLILHAHATESYSGTKGYRSQDDTLNMISIGDRLAELLEEAGIGVIHDRTLHDEPSYSGSYTSARASMKEYLAKYPSIQLVLDLHRDAAEDSQGNQIGYTLSTPQGDAAKLLLVVGTNAGGQNHPQWQKNMTLAVKLHAQLQKDAPGICRSLQIRTSRFNQDLSPGALLVEMGTAGNTHEEAMLAVEILAQSIIALSHGANL